MENWRCLARVSLGFWGAPGASFGGPNTANRFGVRISREQADSARVSRRNPADPSGLWQFEKKRLGAVGGQAQQ